MDFRAAEPADVPATVKLLLHATPGRTLEHEIAYVSAYFERPGTRIQLAVDSGRPVGIASFEPSTIRGGELADERTAYLRLIAVDPELQGTGLATELMTWARTEMSRAGFARAYLWCAEENARALRTHEDWGRMVARGLTPLSHSRQ